MKRLRWLVLVCIAAAPRAASAQLSERGVELYGTAGAVAGATPVHALGASHLGLHGGLLIDGGIQGEHLAVATVLRVWELAPTRTFGGHGLDVSARAEWRATRDAATTYRIAAGAGFDEIDAGRGPSTLDHTGTSGFVASVGMARELFAPSGARIILSADLVLPHVNADVDGRRTPVLEFGFGYRSRFFQPIRMPDTRR